ncbi:Gtr1/RagA G protein conserved region-domain-containing protein [Poronia punctata]|nr:Gtr1/RagA G protein conserved region-domain-containing protein [Poronia punctata]
MADAESSNTQSDVRSEANTLGVTGDVRSEVKKPKKKKVLLMGKSGSGKSSMRSIIFSNYIARDTRRLGATIDIDLSHVKFLGNLTLNLWDCGGQEAFMENYLTQQRVHVFSNVGVLIYVFDIESRDVDRDMVTYVQIISALMQYSPTAKVYVLIHKMDLITMHAREAVFVDRVKTVRQKTAEYIQAANNQELELIPFATSIWDQSLYKAWASIIHDLVPNLSIIESQLGALGTLIEAEEILLFERTSFLVVSSWTSEEGQNNPTGDRQERMSNILKHFKQSISRFTGTPRNAEQFTLMEHKAGTRFSMFICKFTTNTYIMVVLPPGEARFNSAQLNCQIARESFKFLDGPVAGQAQAQ